MGPLTAMTPRRLYSFFALAEMLTWAGLITALVVRASSSFDFVSLAGGIHGFIFLSYVASTLFVWVNQKWRPNLGLVALALAAVPFATVPFELYLLKKGYLAGGWRLTPDGDVPASLLEKLQAAILRRPITAILMVLMALVGLFLTLLWLGPPIPKSS